MKYLNVHPTFVIVAGPNGSGKTTFISKYLSDSDNQLEFLNYDNILKTHASSNLTFSASSGRKLLALFKKYQMESKSFVYETVLSDMSNWLPKKITELQDLNWDVKLFYLWLSSYKISQARVEQRVSSGGHAVPFNMIKTRYSRSLQNLLKIYIPICKTILCYENESNMANLIFSKLPSSKQIIVHDENLFRKMQDQVKEKYFEKHTN